jgi:hypothetical protein
MMTPQHKIVPILACTDADNGNSAIISTQCAALYPYVKQRSRYHRLQQHIAATTEHMD